METKIRQIVFYLFLFMFIWAATINTFNLDYDLWARLIVGKHVFQTGSILRQDFLSYTPTHTWYDHEWGSGVIFYLVQDFFGGVGLIFLQTVLIFLIFFFITKIIELRGGKTTCAYNFLFYFFTIGSINYLLKTPVRCQLFSFLFFAIYLYILERARKNIGRKHELIIALPVLMLIWNNLHGGCVSGIGLILIYIVGEALNKKQVKKYLLPLFLTIAVLPINPWGFKYLAFLYEANTMERKDIIEWWGLFHVKNINRYIKLKFFTSLLIIIQLGYVIKNVFVKKFDFDKTKFLLLIITMYLAIQHVKLIPFFVISAVCFLYDNFYTAFNYITRNIFNKIWIVKDSIIYVIILIFIIGQIKTKHFEQLVNFSKYPVLSVEFLKVNDIKGNVLTNFGLGSYTSYKLYPNNKIYMDGRYEEVYYDFMLPLLKNFCLHKNNWDEILKRFPPDIIIIEKNYSIYQHLKTLKEWSLVFDDDINFGLFIKTKDLKKNYKQPSYESKYYRENVFSTSIDFKSLKIN